jgi:hypothetical protein
MLKNLKSTIIKNGDRISFIDIGARDGLPDDYVYTDRFNEVEEVIVPCN